MFSLYKIEIYSPKFMNETSLKLCSFNYTDTFCEFKFCFSFKSVTYLALFFLSLLQALHFYVKNAMLIFRLFIILHGRIFQSSFSFIKCYVYVYNFISSYYISVQWLCCIVYDILVLDSLQTIALLCFSNYTIAKKKISSVACMYIIVAFCISTIY